MLMEEILHHLGRTKPCKYWDKLPIDCCRISSINSTSNTFKTKLLNAFPSFERFKTNALDVTITFRHNETPGSLRNVCVSLIFTMKNLGQFSPMRWDPEVYTIDLILLSSSPNVSYLHPFPICSCAPVSRLLAWQYLTHGPQFYGGILG